MLRSVTSHLVFCCLISYGLIWSGLTWTYRPVQVLGIPMSSALQSAVKQVAISSGQILVAKSNPAVSKVMAQKQVVAQGVAKAIVSSGGGGPGGGAGGGGAGQQVHTVTKAAGGSASGGKGGGERSHSHICQSTGCMYSPHTHTQTHTPACLCIHVCYGVFIFT